MRCETENPGDATFCKVCGLLLDREKAQQIMERDELLQDIEQLSHLPGGREFFSSIVEDAKTKLAEMLKLQVR